MQPQPKNKIEIIKRTLLYLSMGITVVVTVSLITLFMLGYRFDVNNGNLEQYAFLQFRSNPSGATVEVDGKILDSKTSTKKTVPAGKHDVVMWKDEYETWSKSVDAKSGSLTWLNYTLLIPKSLKVQSIAKYDSVSASLASPKGDYMLVQKLSNVPSFELVDLTADSVKSTTVTIPQDLYTDATTPGVSHVFAITKWDKGDRYVLVDHKYAEKSEWLVLDTQDVALTKNLTRTFDISISKIAFLGTSGNVFYVQNSGDIRKLDLGAGTISRALVSSVSDFDINEESKTVSYISSSASSPNQRVVGVYIDGEDKASPVKTFTSDPSIPLRVAITRYFNEDYLAISEGNKIIVVKGSFSDNISSKKNKLKTITTVNTPQNVDILSLSPGGEYVFAQTGINFSCYDLEYQKFTSSVIEGTGDVRALKWLDDYHVWADRDGKLTVREFDGANSHAINTVVYGQDATLTSNGKYIYSIGKSGVGYQLQRVRMVLP